MEEARLRQASRQFAEAGGDCHDVEIKSPGKCCGRGDRNEEGWPARPPLAQAKNDQNRSNADGDGLQIDAASRLPQGLKLGQERGRFVRHSESKQLPELAGKNDDGDTAVKPTVTGKGMYLHISAEPHETDGDHDDPGHQSGEGQPVIAVPLNDAGTKNDEGAGRAADLKPAAAESGHQEAADDCGVQTSFGTHPRGDRDRHRQGQGNNGDRQPGNGVHVELSRAIAFPQHGHELWREELCKARPRSRSRLEETSHDLSPRKRRPSPLLAADFFGSSR